MVDLPFSRRYWRDRPRLRRGALLVTAFVAAFGFGFAYASWVLVCRDGACPSISMLEVFTPRQTSKMYAADGRFITEIGVERRTLVRLEDIPDVVRQAFVITEDKRFYDHAGIDWVRVAGAAVRNIMAGGYVEGFSTIPMQLARNVFPERISREKTLTRKLKEAKVARAIEAGYSKDKILELYLNQIYLGNGAYGVETAAQRYFGKSVRDLNLAEAATLAALPKAPERYNPRRSPERAIQRRNTIVELMRRQGAIQNTEARLAQAYPLRLAPRQEAGDLAPYFVEWVRKQLEEQFGNSVYTDGLRVYTTLDVDMQLAAERALERQLKAVESSKYGSFKHVTYEQYLARSASGESQNVANSPYLQGAFIALDPRTGSVRALVGGRDFDDSKFNRATQALRQPGSTFKPVVYAEAIREGRPPSYMIEDAPLSVPQVDGTDWTPQNYDLEFHGPVPMRRALYLSRNLPTVRLGMELGEENVIAMARRLGISSPIPAYPSIHLGAAGVYPIELVSAYSTFATLGIRAQPNAIVRVENAQGDVLWEATPVRQHVMSREEAWLMVDMMKDVARRGTAAGAVWGAGFRHPSGGKTGTTNDYTDVWYIGYTPDLVAGLWIGFDRPQRIQSNAQGGRLAAPAWTAFMTEVYQRRPAPPDWPRPEGLIMMQVDRTTGLLANPFCPLEDIVSEYFIVGTEPIQECNMHSPFSIDAQSDSASLSQPPPGAPPPRPGRPQRDTTRPIPDPFKLPR
ncbi:MAG TPA: PBP1A family penicillin-binding protein [Gemmatimonadaceae bacterium]|nr:PBP1A family penicillin-binding protein [Gemmatimonadaceae bacterium]